VPFHRRPWSRQPAARIRKGYRLFDLAAHVRGLDWNDRLQVAARRLPQVFRKPLVRRQQRLVDTVPPEETHASSGVGAQPLSAWSTAIRISSTVMCPS